MRRDVDILEIRLDLRKVCGDHTRAATRDRAIRDEVLLRDDGAIAIPAQLGYEESPLRARINCARMISSSVKSAKSNGYSNLRELLNMEEYRRNLCLTVWITKGYYTLGHSYIGTPSPRPAEEILFRFQVSIRWRRPRDSLASL